ncbi:MAG: hypothetical protein OEZ34_07225 [Spirochaetia bacterium]|nr:hypothetical protein [Spirochaetia bacterium]
MKSILFVFAVFVLAVQLSALPAKGTLSDRELKQGIVLVRISSIHYNDLLPWRSQAGNSYTVTGLVLKGNRILVLSSDIQNASLVEVWKYSSYRKNIAKIIKRDNEANLALLEVENPDFFNDLRPIEFGRDPHVGRIVNAMSIDGNFRAHNEDVKITDVNAVSDLGTTTLPYLFFRTSEPFNGGGVLLCGDRLCGFIGFTNNDKRAQAILPSVVQAFRSESSSPFVSQGFDLENMEDPVLKEYYGMPAKLSGALVTRVIPGTSVFGVLEKNDIILSIAGRNLDDRGFYNDPKFGLQKGQLLFVRDGDRVRKEGETIPIKVLRNKNVTKLTVSLKSYDGSAERIPAIVEGPPPYLIESGYVFVELSLPYLRDGYGSSWRSRAAEMAYLFDTQRFLEKPGKERIIVLVGVYPDDVNRGYEKIRSVPVKSIDGQSITDLSQIHRILSNGNGNFHMMELSTGMQVYITSRNRDETNRRIQQRYSLPELSRMR